MPPAREQIVHVLSPKSGTSFRAKVKSVHYDKNLGIAEISREACEDFVQRYYPDRHGSFVHENGQVTYPVFINFEELLTAIEQLPPYQVLLKVALTGKIESAEEKANIRMLIVLQFLRSHALMSAMIDWHRELGRPKFEHFITLKWLLSDEKLIFELVNPIVCCEWALFSTDSEEFPLCDSPILMKPQSILVASVYREARGKRMDTSEAGRLAYILSSIGKLIEATAIEKRLEQLEGKLLK